MTKQELEEELEARQWRPKQVYTPQAKKALAQITKAKNYRKKAQQKAQVKAHLESSKNAPRNQKGSISFKKSNPIQMYHNDRTEPPSYLLESGGMGVECNRDNREAQILKQKLIDEASRAYTARTGQRLQAKSYEWSAVCNIKPDTTMQDLERLAKHFETKYGFQCYQIAIHRDEGHIDDNGLEQINHHAHLEFITLDKESGRNNYRRELITPSVLRQMQTEVAEILQMERGIDKRVSKRERIEPRYFAKLADEIKQETKIQKEREILQSAITKLKDQITQEPQESQIKLTSDKNEIIYLNVPYNEKDEAKELGAKWDRDKKQWYIPQVDCTPFAKWWLPNFKTKSQEIAELHDKVAEKDKALDKVRGERNTAQASLENAKKEIVTIKAIKAEYEVLRKEMIKWGFCDKDDYKIRTDLLKQSLENAKKKEFTQDDLNTAIAEAKQEIQERHKAEIEALKTTLQEANDKVSKEPNIATSGERKPIAIASPYDSGVIMTTYATTTFIEPSNLVQENELLRQELAKTKLAENEKDRALNEIAQIVGREGKSYQSIEIGVRMLANRLKELEQNKLQEQDLDSSFTQTRKNKDFER